MPTTYQDLIDVTTAEDTTIDSVVALLDGMKTQIADLMSGANIPPAVQAQITAVFDKVTGGKAKLDAALAANVPAENPTP